MVACEGKVVAGRLPAGTDCASEDATKKRISKARGKLKHAIAQACGGKDRTCGTGNDDVALAAVGWDLGTCPNVGGGTCTNAINDCNGISTCLRCMSEAEIAQAVTLYYGALQPTDPKNKTQHALNGCQVGIGKAAARFLAAKSAALTKCWAAVSAEKIAGTCPDADPKTVAAIAKAESSKEAAICRACGGADKLCGGADDFTPTEIGFTATCPDVSAPGGASCTGAVTALPDLVTCVDCVTEARTDCATLATVPALVPYPAECQ